TLILKAVPKTVVTTLPVWIINGFDASCLISKYPSPDKYTSLILSPKTFGYFKTEAEFKLIVLPSAKVICFFSPAGTFVSVNSRGLFCDDGHSMYIAKNIAATAAAAAM